MYFNTQTVIYYRGAFVNASEASADLYGQSLHYGYAVFEGIRAYPMADGPKMFKGAAHYDRLRHSAQVMGIPMQETTAELCALTDEVLRRNRLQNAYIRPIVTCSPNMGLTTGKEAYLAILAWDWTNGYLSSGMRVMTSPYRRPNPEAFHIEAKVSGHYVNSIMACQDAKNKGFDEALLLDADGYVAEGPGANVFYERDGVLYTPPKGNILPGITRATVIEICDQLNIPVRETQFYPEDMHGADAAFFCGTAAEVADLISLDNIPFQKRWQESRCALVQEAYARQVRGHSLSYVKSIA